MLRSPPPSLAVAECHHRVLTYALVPCFQGVTVEPAANVTQLYAGGGALYLAGVSTTAASATVNVTGTLFSYNSLTVTSPVNSTLELLHSGGAGLFARSAIPGTAPDTNFFFTRHLRCLHCAAYHGGATAQRRLHSQHF